MSPEFSQGMKILENEDLNTERFINVNRGIEEKLAIYRNIYKEKKSNKYEI